MQTADIAGSYDPGLVVVSVFIAAIASYAALDLASRVTAARGTARASWLSGGAFAMGIGIWSMHYIGMLAFQLPVPVLYDVPTVLVSLLAAVFASAVALWVVSRRRMGLREAVPGSIVMGLGIAAMHYIGMAAMRLQAAMRFDPWLVTLSVAIAIVVSFVALWLAFHLRGEAARRWLAKKLGSAALMGGAIASMHYTGMAAAAFTPATTATPAPHAVEISSLGATAIAVSTFMVLFMAIGTAVADRRLTAGTAALATSEQARRVQDLFLREVIDANPHFVFAKDWDGRFTLANKAVAAVYGTTPDELVGRSDADFNPNQEEVEQLLAADREVMATGQPKVIPEEPVTDATTGETRWYQTIKVPLQSPDGTARQVLGVATDITQRKLLEDQLVQAQKMEAVGRLAGGIAHDFNNLLTVVMGHVGLLVAEMARDDPHRPELEEVLRATQRAATLTQQLLAFSRKQVLQPKVLDLNDLVRGTHKLLRRLIGEDVELRTALGDGLGSVEADPGQLEQVIMNLAVNARDAMPRGGMLTIETANVELDDTYAREHVDVAAGRYVMLAVTDTGTGMDVRTKAHLFEPFFTTKGPGRGTGLGLATVHGIVKQSGGHIWVYSEPGGGTTFKVYLPRVVGGVDKADAPARSPESRGRGGAETILLVEDEDAVRRLASTVLERRGYAVLAGCDGEAALQLAARHTGPLDLLVTDVVMPRMSGPQLAAQLTQARPGLKVLYLSGYTDDTIIHHGVLREGVAFLQKPFSPEALTRKVREVLDAPRSDA